MADRIPEDEALERAKTKAETDKKCPGCGGTMDFDPETGGLACPFCGHVAEILSAGASQELDFLTAEQTGNYDWGAEKKTVLCKSCGAEQVLDALEISAECPYCGSNQVVEEKGRDSLAPGGVCIFKLNAKKAGELFTGWIKKKWFCPRKAKQKAKPEAFTGMYLPYWTFDSDTSSSYTASYGIDRTVRDSDGKTRTETDWYRTSGNYSAFIDDQPVIATTRMDAGLLKSIEPFDTAENLLYKPEYVAGFASERYSVGLQDGWEKAKQFIASRLQGEITSEIMRRHHADHVRSLQVSTAYAATKYKYLLLPVWISSFRYKEKVYHFAVNGQTGRVGGKTPVSALRVLLAVAIGIAIVALFYYFMR